MLNLRARQYEPTQMRFSQRDLLRGDMSAPSTLNRYLYCANDPVNFADFNGLALKDLWNKAKTAVQKAAKTVGNWVNDKIEKVKNSAVGKAVSNFASTVSTAVKTAVAKNTSSSATKQAASSASASSQTSKSNPAASVNRATSSTTKKSPSAQTATKQLETVLTSAGIDTNKLTDSQRKLVQDAQKQLQEKAANGTLTQQEMDRIIGRVCTEVTNGETTLDPTPGPTPTPTPLPQPGPTPTIMPILPWVKAIYCQKQCLYHYHKR